MLKLGVGKKNLRNRIDRKTKSKNRLIELSGSILVFVLHKYQFWFIKYKNRGLVNQPKNKKYIYKTGFPTCVSCDFPTFFRGFYFFHVIPFDWFLFLFKSLKHLVD